MDDEHPGYIVDYLQQQNIDVRLIRAYDGDSIPSVDDTFAGLVFMGGIMSVNDGLAWLDEEIELIKVAATKRIPLLGHCLGGQMIAKALGGKITFNPQFVYETEDGQTRFCLFRETWRKIDEYSKRENDKISTSKKKKKNN